MFEPQSPKLKMTLLLLAVKSFSLIDHLGKQVLNGNNKKEACSPATSAWRL